MIGFGEVYQSVCREQRYISEWDEVTAVSLKNGNMTGVFAEMVKECGRFGVIMAVWNMKKSLKKEACTKGMEEGSDSDSVLIAENKNILV